jgi:hypothetical protein
MDRSREINMAEALNQAIWLRDNVDKLDRDAMEIAIKDLASHRLFSSRQISAIVNGAVDHGSIAKLIKKEDKTGGNLNVGTLEILRNVLYSRANNQTDYTLISKALEEGTSQGMIARLTGVSQSSISRRLNG